MKITKETKNLMEQNGFTVEEQDDIVAQIAAVCFDKRIVTNYAAKHNLSVEKEEK